MIRVMIVDDHELVREGIKRLLIDSGDIEVIAEADSGKAAIAAVKANRPDVILMDVTMPDMDGLETTRKLLRIDPSLKILALSAHVEEPYPSRVLQAGSLGYITKDSDSKTMISAIKLIQLGKRYLSPEVAQNLALKSVNHESDSPFDALSDRETQIMLMITKGQRPNIIAKQLNLSPKTVNTYRYRLFEKLHVNSDVELTHLAIRYKIIDNL